MGRVLVVDDDELIRRLLAAALARAGHEVVGVATVDSAIEEMHRSRPDLVLLDLELPGKDGVACLRHIRQSPSTSHLNVVVISAAPSREFILRVARLGVQGFIVKSTRLVHEVSERLGRILPASKLSPQRPPSPAPSQGTTVTATPKPAGSTPSTEEQTPRPDTALAAIPYDAGLAEACVDHEWAAVPIEEANEQLRALHPLVTRDAVQRHINAASELAAMGPAARHVLSVARSPSSSVETIAKAIRQDQALSLKVLKLANSPLYNTGERVDAVAKAVARIGVDQIQQAITSMSVIEEFASPELKGRIRADWFWEHSIATALIASSIVRARGGSPAQADMMFTAGLLHDVGRMLFATHLGEVYARVLETADRLGLPVESVESRLLLLNHADLTDYLLRVWKFPADLVGPISFHHLSLGNIRRAAPRMVEAVCTLALANRLAHALLLGCSGNDAVYPIEDLLGALGLGADFVAQVSGQVPEQTTDLKCTMLLHAADQKSDAFLDSTRARLGVVARPLPVSVQPGTDTVALMLGRLFTPTSPPNVTVVRVTTPRDRSALMDLVKDSEAKAGVQPLPTLVAASTPACFFAPGMLGARQLVQLVVPSRVSRLGAALAGLLGERRAEQIKAAA